jgi:hypothetical protein
VKLAAVLLLIALIIAAAVCSLVAVWTLPEPSRTWALASIGCSIVAAFLAWLIDE